MTRPCPFSRYTQSSNVFIVLRRTAAKRNVLFSFVKNVVISVTNIFFLSICNWYRVSRPGEQKFFYFTLLTSIYSTLANWWKSLF